MQRFSVIPAGRRNAWFGLDRGNYRCSTLTKDGLIIGNVGARISLELLLNRFQKWQPKMTWQTNADGYLHVKIDSRADACCIAAAVDALDVADNEDACVREHAFWLIEGDRHLFEVVLRWLREVRRIGQNSPHTELCQDGSYRLLPPKSSPAERLVARRPNAVAPRGGSFEPPVLKPDTDVETALRRGFLIVKWGEDWIDREWFSRLRGSRTPAMKVILNDSGTGASITCSLHPGRALDADAQQEVFLFLDTEAERCKRRPHVTVQACKFHLGFVPMWRVEQVAFELLELLGRVS